jgi:hypothetical protein
MTELSERIFDLRAQGKSYSYIQNELGCSKGTIAYHLGVGQKEKTATRQRDRRTTIKKYIQDIKQNAVCAVCGEDYPHWIMEFDHRSDKLFNISEWFNTTRSLDVIKIEIAKCDIVCANCHKNRTYCRLLGGGGNTLNVAEYYSGKVPVG